MVNNLCVLLEAAVQFPFKKFTHQLMTTKPQCTQLYNLVTNAECFVFRHALPQKTQNPIYRVFCFFKTCLKHLLKCKLQICCILTEKGF